MLYSCTHYPYGNSGRQTVNSVLRLCNVGVRQNATGRSWPMYDRFSCLGPTSCTACEESTRSRWCLRRQQWVTSSTSPTSTWPLITWHGAHAFGSNTSVIRSLRVSVRGLAFTSRPLLLSYCIYSSSFSTGWSEKWRDIWFENDKAGQSRWIDHVRWLDSVAVGRWTRDQEVAGSTPTAALFGQQPWASCSHLMCLCSPSSIIWYTLRGPSC